MSRPLRIDYPGAWHYVMNQARKGSHAFERKKDYEDFLALLQETAALFNVGVVSYCLMPDHYHLLVQTPDATLSRFMRHLNGVYTQRYNMSHFSDGSLFKGRYSSILVDADSYLLPLTRFTHRIPLRTGWCKTLDGYPWNSYGAYLSQARKWNWMLRGAVRSMINPGASKPFERYKRYMNREDSDELITFFNKKKRPSVLGSDDFIRGLKGRFYDPKNHAEVPESRKLAPEVDDIIRMVAKAYKVDEASLFKARRGMENEPRNMAVYLVRELRAETLSEIAPKFNMTRYSSVSSILERVRKKMSDDKSFVIKKDSIKKMIVMQNH